MELIVLQRVSNLLARASRGLGSYKCTRKRRKVINRFGRGVPLLATEYRFKVF